MYFQTIEGLRARISARVANNNMCAAVKFEQERGGGRCSVQGPVASTKRQRSTRWQHLLPHLQELEGTVGTLLGSIVSMTVGEGSILVVASSDGKREEFVRAEKRPPATNSMINWLFRYRLFHDKLVEQKHF